MQSCTDGSRPQTGKTGKTGSEVDYSAPPAPPPPYVSPIGHHPHSHHPLHHRIPAAPSRPPQTWQVEPKVPLPGSPRRSQFTPRSRLHQALSPPPQPSPRQGYKFVFRLPHESSKDDLLLITPPHSPSLPNVSHDRGSPRRPPKQPWPRQVQDDVFSPAEERLLPPISNPGTPLGGVGSSIKIKASTLGDLSAVGEVSHEEIEASIVSKKSAAGVGGLVAPLPILSGALRYTVGAYARKIEEVHHASELRSSHRAPA